MADVFCPFCGVEGFAKRNDNYDDVIESKEEIKHLWGIDFVQHIGNCPLNTATYRANYLSKEEAIKAHIPKNNLIIKKEPRCFRCDKLIESAGDDSSIWDMASGAVIMDGGCSYGSRIYDTYMDGISIRILVCDDCLKECQNKVLEIKNE